MAAAVMIALGLALMCGAEVHYSNVMFAMQAVVGLGLFIAGLMVGKHDLAH